MVGKIRLFDPLLQVRHFTLVRVAFAKLLLDRLQLLAQDVLTLIFSNLGLRLAGDLVPQLKDLDFLGKKRIERTQQLDRR
jgi:hypothetical protein